MGEQYDDMVFVYSGGVHKKYVRAIMGPTNYIRYIFIYYNLHTSENI